MSEWEKGTKKPTPFGCGLIVSSGYGAVIMGHPCRIAGGLQILSCDTNLLLLSLAQMMPTDSLLSVEPNVPPIGRV